jgi:dihydroorotate dehydrogenase
MCDFKKLKKILFRIDPETTHQMTELAVLFAQTMPFFLPLLKRNYSVSGESLTQTIFGRQFPNPIGLSAGFDKNATMIRGMSALGFGFVEVGTVTPLAQEGNPRPRLFRFPEYESLQNAMGFNNDGMESVLKRMERTFSPQSLSALILENKATPQEEAIKDYQTLINAFKDLCDYLVINISSPNTPQLRDLQNERFIADLFKTARQVTSRPILLKIAPDMDKAAAVSLCSTAVEHGASGIIAANTSTDYSLLPGAREFGGISGKVIREKNFAIFDSIAGELYGKTILISVGGIDSGKEAYRRFKAGASLVQIYSAMIFQGPALVGKINKELLELMERDGVKNITEIIGIERR